MYVNSQRNGNKYSYNSPSNLNEEINNQLTVEMQKVEYFCLRLKE